MNWLFSVAISHPIHPFDALLQREIWQEYNIVSMINTGFHDAPDLDPGNLWQVIVLSTSDHPIDCRDRPGQAPSKTSILNLALPEYNMNTGKLSIAADWPG